MLLYIVSLKSGASIVATNYYKISSTEIRLDALGQEGSYTYDILDQDILDIQEVDSEEMPELLEKTYEKSIKKESCFLDESYSMYDMCYCMAKCKKPCARKRATSGICTVSDFTNVCSDFEGE